MQHFVNNAENNEEEEREKMADICIEIIHNKYPFAKYALWLADKDIVKDLYGGTEEDIDMYEIPNTLPISDLDKDGKLYVFDKKPQKINK